MPGRASILQSSLAIEESGPVMVLSCEADTHAAAQLRELLVAQLFRGRRRLVIDVARLRHIDSESVRVLVVAAKMLRERDGELVLLHPQSAVARMLELMGADQGLTMSEPPEPLPRSSGQGDRNGTSPWPIGYHNSMTEGRRSPLISVSSRYERCLRARAAPTTAAGPIAPRGPAAGAAPLLPAKFAGRAVGRPAPRPWIVTVPG
jgi:stage II sporulation protein AA (anti-sigma F factor antagonist)